MGEVVAETSMPGTPEPQSHSSSGISLDNHSCRQTTSRATLGKGAANTLLPGGSHPHPNPSLPHWIGQAWFQALLAVADGGLSWAWDEGRAPAGPTPCASFPTSPLGRQDA